MLTAYPSDAYIDQIKEQVLHTFQYYINKTFGGMHIPSLRLFGGAKHMGRAKYIANKIELYFDLESIKALLEKQKALFLGELDSMDVSGYGLDPDFVKYETQLKNRESIPQICVTERQRMDYLPLHSDFFCVIDDALNLLQPGLVKMNRMKNK